LNCGAEDDDKAEDDEDEDDEDDDDKAEDDKAEDDKAEDDKAEDEDAGDDGDAVGRHHGWCLFRRIHSRVDGESSSTTTASGSSRSNRATTSVMNTGCSLEARWKQT
jgi:hypothetical protein